MAALTQIKRQHDKFKEPQVCTNRHLLVFTSRPERTVPVTSSCLEKYCEGLQAASAEPEPAASTLGTLLLWFSAWGCQHRGVSESGAPCCTPPQPPCSQTHTGICRRGEVPLWLRHQPDGSVPLTKRKGMQHLPMTEKARVVLHIGSSFKCVSSHCLAFCFSAMLDAGVGKLNSPKVNFLSYYKLTLGVAIVTAERPAGCVNTPSRFPSLWA